MRAAQASLNSAIARTQRAKAAKSTVPVDRSRSQECHRAEKSGRGAIGLHQCLCARHRHGLSARGSAGRSGQHRSTYCNHRRYSSTPGRGQRSRRPTPITSATEMCCASGCPAERLSAAGFFQRRGRRLRHAAQREPDEARYQDHRARKCDWTILKVATCQGMTAKYWFHRSS